MSANNRDSNRRAGIFLDHEIMLPIDDQLKIFVSRYLSPYFKDGVDSEEVKEIVSDLKTLIGSYAHDIMSEQSIPDRSIDQHIAPKER